MSWVWRVDWDGLRRGFWGGTKDHHLEVSGMGVGRSGSHQSVATPSRKVIIPYSKNILKSENEHGEMKGVIFIPGRRAGKRRTMHILGDHRRGSFSGTRRRPDLLLLRTIEPQ